jgi:YbbR-like protein
VIWRALTHNFLWKLASLALSIMLWLAIVGEPVLVTTHTTPILYRNVPANLILGADALDSVRIELRGPSSRLSATNLADLSVLLDLSDISGPGEHTYTLSDSDIHLPQGVTFLRAVPSQLRVQFARLESKDVPVQIRIVAPPPEGLRVSHQEVVPAQLRIAGPEGPVDRTDNAQTDGIDLSGLGAGTSVFHVATLVSDPRVRLESSPMVTVTVVIEKGADKTKH